MLGEVGRYAEAIDLLGRELGEHPSDARLLTVLSRYEGQLGRTGDALRDAREAVRHAPSRAEPHLALGLALFSDTKLAEAREAFQRATTLNPHVERHLLALAEAELALGELQAAAECLERAETLAPGCGQWMRVRLSLLNHEPDEALSESRSDLSDTPAEAAALIRRSYVLRATGLLEEALDCARAAAQLAPTGSAPDRVANILSTFADRALSSAAREAGGLERLTSLAERLDQSEEVFLAAWVRMCCAQEMRSGQHRNDPARRSAAHDLRAMALPVRLHELPSTPQLPMQHEHELDLCRQALDAGGERLRRRKFASWYLETARNLLWEPSSDTNLLTLATEHTEYALSLLTDDDVWERAVAQQILGCRVLRVKHAAPGQLDEASSQLSLASDLFGRCGDFGLWALTQLYLSQVLALSASFYGP
jgi:tetratricopeptide (TPR) repeat protein